MLLKRSSSKVIFVLNNVCLYQQISVYWWPVLYKTSPSPIGNISHDYLTFWPHYQSRLISSELPTDTLKSVTDELIDTNEQRDLLISLCQYPMKKQKESFIH